MRIADQYPGTTAHEVQALADNSAWKALTRHLREETIAKLTMLDCVEQRDQVIDTVRRLQVLNDITYTVEMVSAAARKETR